MSERFSIISYKFFREFEFRVSKTEAFAAKGQKSRIFVTLSNRLQKFLILSQDKE